MESGTGSKEECRSSGSVPNNAVNKTNRTSLSVSPEKSENAASREKSRSSLSSENVDKTLQRESQSSVVYSTEMSTLSGTGRDSSGSALLGLAPQTGDEEVNVNQFYPMLTPKLRGMSESDETKDSDFGLTDEEKKERQLVKAPSNLSSSNKSGRTPEPKSVKFEDEEALETPSSAGKKSEGDVFSTAVDEEVLEAAKERIKSQKGGIFLPEEWAPGKDSMVTAKEIIHDQAQVHYERGLKLYSDGELEKSIIAFNKAINLRSDVTEYFTSRADSFIDLCDYESAILNYKKACCLSPTNDELYSKLAFIYFFQGQCLFDQKLYPEALEAFSKAAEMRPEVMGYHTRSIACLAALQRHGECLALVNKRLEEDTGNADLYVMRARLHELFRNSTLCSYDVKDALSLEPEHPEAMKLLKKLQEKAAESKDHAMQLSVLGKHKEALQKISVAIETDPGNPSYHVFRGALHRRLADFNAAIDDYLLALDKTDHNEESPIYVDAQRQLLLTYNDFAVECFNKGYYEEAVILLNKAIKGEKREKGLYVNRGDCFYRQEDLHFALADYHQALELDPMDNTIRSRISVVHNEFGVNEYQIRNYTEAESRFSLAIQNNPKIGHYYLSRARTRYMLEHSGGARTDCLFALLLDPHNEELMSLVSRLFPGRGVKEILQSRAAQSAKLALQNATVTASPIKLKSLKENEGSDDESSEGDASDQASSSGSGAEAPAPKKEFIPMWKPERGLPDFKACMEEWDFNIKVAVGKKMIGTSLKKHYHERAPLKYLGARVQPLPPAVPYQRRGGNMHKKEEVLLDPTTGKKSSGWRQFGQGIGLLN